MTYIGWSVGVFLPICCAMVPFYFQTWEEYYSGEMIFPILNGPNEGLMMVVFMNFFTFVVGPMWWQTVRMSISCLRRLYVLVVKFLSIDLHTLFN